MNANVTIVAKALDIPGVVVAEVAIVYVSTKAKLAAIHL